MKVLSREDAIAALKSGGCLLSVGSANPYYFLSNSLRTIRFATATDLIKKGLVKPAKQDDPMPTRYIWDDKIGGK